MVIVVVVVVIVVCTVSRTINTSSSIECSQLISWVNTCYTILVLVKVISPAEQSEQSRTQQSRAEVEQNRLASSLLITLYHPFFSFHFYWWTRTNIQRLEKSCWSVLAPERTGDIESREKIKRKK